MSSLRLIIFGIGILTSIHIILSSTNSDMDLEPPYPCPARCDMIKEIDVLRGEMQTLRQMLYQESLLRLTFEQNVNTQINRAANTIEDSVATTNKSLFEKIETLEDKFNQVNETLLAGTIQASVVINELSKKIDHTVENAEKSVEILNVSLQENTRELAQNISQWKMAQRQSMDELSSNLKLVTNELMRNVSENKNYHIHSIETIRSNLTNLIDEQTHTLSLIKNDNQRSIETLNVNITATFGTLQSLEMDLQNERSQRINGENECERKLMELTHTTNILNQTRTNQVEHIAFSATNGKTVSKTIIFGSVKLNLGNAYSDSTGVFTAPYPGIYAFFWTIATDNKKNCDTELSINNSGTYRSMVQSSEIDEDNSGSQTVIARLSRGDVVKIREHTSQYSCSKIHSEWSSFSGFRYA